MACLFVCVTIAIPLILIKDISADLAGPLLRAVPVFIQLIHTMRSSLLLYTGLMDVPKRTF